MVHLSILLAMVLDDQVYFALEIRGKLVDLFEERLLAFPPPAREILSKSCRSFFERLDPLPESPLPFLVGLNLVAESCCPFLSSLENPAGRSVDARHDEEIRGQLQCQEEEI